MSDDQQDQFKENAADLTGEKTGLANPEISRQVNELFATVSASVPRDSLVMFAHYVPRREIREYMWQNTDKVSPYGTELAQALKNEGFLEPHGKHGLSFKDMREIRARLYRKVAGNAQGNATIVTKTHDGMAHSQPHDSLLHEAVRTLSHNPQIFNINGIPRHRYGVLHRNQAQAVLARAEEHQKSGQNIHRHPAVKKAGARRP